MKFILTILLSFGFVASGFSQTRNVVADTNGVVVQPTNIWTANATNARSGLGLGTAATNPASAFQPSSVVLSNLAASNASSLTNIQGSSIVGTAPLASNVTGVVALANGGTAGTNAATARTSLGATTVGANLFTLANPDDVRFIRLNANNTVSALNASDMRTALSVNTNLGTVTSVGMTVPSIFSLSASTITSSGTFAISLSNQTSRQVFIAPNGGGVPTFRAIESDDLPNLAISKITNLQAALDGKLSTSGTAALATNVTGVVGLANGGTGGTNAESARVGLGIGSAGTNASSAFQPASTVLSDLANSNGFILTNLNASNITGLIPASNISSVAISNLSGTLAISSGGTGATNAGQARTNLGLGWSALTNVNDLAFRSAINIGESNVVYFSEVGVGRGADNYTMSGTANQTNQNFGFSFKQSGTPFLTISNLSGTNGGALIFHGSAGASTTRANIGFSTNLNTLWTANSASNARSAIGLGNSDIAQFGEIKLKPALEENSIPSIVSFDNQDGTESILIKSSTGNDIIYIEDGGTTSFQESVLFALAPTFADAATTRNNLGLGATWLTNTNVTNFRTAIELGQTNAPSFRRVVVDPLASGSLGIQYGVNDSGLYNGANYNQLSLRVGGVNALTAETNGVTFANPSAVRTNLGLGWPALMNSNAGTGLVSVDTNGDVVSPTNFWQRAPIQTLVQDFTVIVTSQTNNATNARNVYIYSLATNVSGISNTIILPTNTSTFNGDEITVIHKGTTNTTTIVRQDGSTNNLIALNRFDDSVKFIRELGQWDFYHNISFVEPIQFSGTNISANISASRENLGLGQTNSVTFSNLYLTRPASGDLTLALGQTNTGFKSSGGGPSDFSYARDGINILGLTANIDFYVPTRAYNTFTFQYGGGSFGVISFGGVDAEGGKAISRTNLGLGLPALTNTSNTRFQEAIFTTNAAPTNTANINTVNFNAAVAWMEVSIVTNNVTNSYRVPLFK